MKSLNELLLDAPRLGDKYGVNLRARLTDERLDELFDGAELTSDELKLLRTLGNVINGGTPQDPKRWTRQHPDSCEPRCAEDIEWWGLLVQHLPPSVASTTVPAFRRVVAEKYLTVDYRQLRLTVIRSTVHPKTLEELRSAVSPTDEGETA